MKKNCWSILTGTIVLVILINVVFLLHLRVNRVDTPTTGLQADSVRMKLSAKPAGQPGVVQSDGKAADPQTAHRNTETSSAHHSTEKLTARHYTETLTTRYNTESTHGDTKATPKPAKRYNPSVDLTVLRQTSFDEIPDKVTVKCKLDVPNPTPYRNKKHCCQAAEKRTLPELCGEVNATTIRNDSHVPGCTCADLMACKGVVLAATSSNHWVESLDALASVQNTMPDMKIIVMDLGMSAGQAEQLQRMRNVEVRKFPFDSFPPHVKRVDVFAWKSLSMKMTLSEYEVVFYMDTSIRLKRPLVDLLYPAVQKFPIKVNSNGIYDAAFTRDETYKYLGVTRKQMSKLFQKEGGLQMYRNCSFLQQRIMSHLVDCALHEECIAPSGASAYGCNLGSYWNQVKNIDTLEQLEYVGCHRFDQSVITAVLEKEFHFPNFSPPVDSLDFTNSLVLWRYPSKCFTLFLDN